MEAKEAELVASCEKASPPWWYSSSGVQAKCHPLDRNLAHDRHRQTEADGPVDGKFSFYRVGSEHYIFASKERSCRAAGDIGDPRS